MLPGRRSARPSTMKATKPYKVFTPRTQSAAKGLTIELARGEDARPAVLKILRDWIAWFKVVASKSLPKLKAPKDLEGPSATAWWEEAIIQSENMFAANGHRNAGWWDSWPPQLTDDLTDLYTALATGPTTPLPK